VEEDTADGEPTLGSQEGGHGGARWNRPLHAHTDDGELEPSLGWRPTGNQDPHQLGAGADDDREDGGEEAVLNWAETLDQSVLIWSH
jgi:hypothetical protein